MSNIQNSMTQIQNPNLSL